MFLLCCKNKKENAGEDSSFFPTLSFIKSQVAHVDTSVYRIIKIVKTENGTDTSFLRREDFREAAKDFLTLPDLSSEKWKDDYTETEFFDPGLQQVVLNYMPKDAGAEITRQAVMIEPGAGGDKVKSLFISRTLAGDDSLINKVLFWEVDKRFKIVTTIEKPGIPKKNETVEVIWNDFPSR